MDAMAHQNNDTQRESERCGTAKSSSFRCRRTRSDLGFKSKLFRSKRTLALLQNPSMRKHVAQSMGLNPDDPCFVEMVTSKLDLAHLSEANACAESVEQAPPPPPSVLMRSKMSSSSGDIQKGCLSIATSTRTKSEPDIADMNDDPHERRIHIPSFDEFRKRLRRNSQHRPVSTSCEFLSMKDRSRVVPYSSQQLKPVSSLQSLSKESSYECGEELKSVRFVEDSVTTKPSGKCEEVTSDLEEEASEISTAQSHSCEDFNVDPQVPVLRSTSDVSDMVAEEGRKKVAREKRTKPYKSDPFCTTSQNGSSPPTPPSVIYENTTDGMSKRDVLSFLHDVTHTDDVSMSNSTKCLEGSGKQHKVSTDHETRPYDTTRPPQTSSCLMCRQMDVNFPESFVCEDCIELSAERREVIQEIIETEKNFYRNLVTLRDEFFLPLESSGLLSPDQLKLVFSNLHELVFISKEFRRQLSDSLSLATKKGDTDYVSVLIGRPFLETSSMLLAFETYCTGQSGAQNLLEQLMEEKSLLRLFLEESLKENEALRRMDLKTFLMVPVQRIMKYPLLLGRLLKTTPKHHTDYKAIWKAKSRMDEILDHINMKSKGTVSIRSKRKSAFANIVKNAESAEAIELNKAALDVLGWSRHEAYCLHTGHLQHALLSDHLWPQKLASLKFHPSHAVLVSFGRNPNLESEAGQCLLFPHESSVKDVALVLLKDKNGRFVALRDSISLAHCVVSKETRVPSVFLLSEFNETLIMKGTNTEETTTWLHLLQLHGKDMGKWRRRRKALPNIMMHHKP